MQHTYLNNRQQDEEDDSQLQASSSETQLQKKIKEDKENANIDNKWKEILKWISTDNSFQKGERHG